jgi:hypothetical protein
MLDWPEWVSVMPVGVAAVGLLLALVLLGVALRLLLRPFVWAARYAINFGGAAGTPTTSAAAVTARVGLALLVAAVFQPSPFVSVLALFLSLVSFLAYSLPFALIRMASELPQACTADWGQKCAAPILRAATDIWSGPIVPIIPTDAGTSRPTEYLSFQDVISVKDILKSLNTFLTQETYAAFEALLIAAIAFILIGLYPIATTMTRNIQWNQEYARIFSKIAGLVVSFIFAIYLAITAIVAIPIFNDRTDKFDDGNKYLEQELPRAMGLYISPSIPNIDLTNLPDTEKIRLDGRTLIDQKFQAAKNANAQPGAPAPGLQLLGYDAVSAKLWLNAQVDEVQSRISNMKGSAKALEQASAAMKDEAERFKLRIQMLFALQDKGHINGSLTMQHAAELASWYGTWLADYRTKLVQCATGVDRQKLLIQEWIVEIPKRLEAGLASSADMSVLALRSSSIRTADFPECEELLPPVREYVTSRENVEATLGLFGRATGWLLRTEKRDLALIVGLLGFGLFGALGSSFIRRAQSNEPLAEAAIVLPALIRGVSAAIVIFLAVLGGISVFTNSDPTPNPYVVFFACFVAAVFSEDVWDWAHRRQTAQLNSDIEAAKAGAAKIEAAKADAAKAEAAKSEVAKRDAAKGEAAKIEAAKADAAKGEAAKSKVAKLETDKAEPAKVEAAKVEAAKAEAAKAEAAKAKRERIG